MAVVIVLFLAKSAMSSGLQDVGGSGKARASSQSDADVFSEVCHKNPRKHCIKTIALLLKSEVQGCNLAARWIWDAQPNLHMLVWGHCASSLLLGIFEN